MPSISNFTVQQTGDPQKLRVSFRITWTADDTGRNFATSIYFTERDGAQDNMGLLAAYFSGSANLAPNLKVKLIRDAVAGDADDLSSTTATLVNSAPYTSDPTVTSGASSGFVDRTYHVLWPVNTANGEPAAEEMEKWDVYVFITPAGMSAAARTKPNGALDHNI